jgi:hypothetical protein
MEGRKTAGIVLLVLGIIVLVLFSLADAIGIGVSAGFGYRQAIGAFAGAIAAVVGLVLVLK